MLEFINFRRLRMESLIGLMENVNINNFDIGSSSWVDVTHINNPHSFYIRSTSYRMYMPEIQARGEKAVASDLRLEPIFIYKSKALKYYCRGKILFVNQHDDKITCDMFAIDFGCLEKSISLKRIYKPKHKISIPPLAFHCQLADCKPKDNYWTHKEIDAMKFFVGNERAKLIVRGKMHDKLIVELMNSCPDDIATILALTGYTNFGYTGNQISRMPSLSQEKHYYDFKKLHPSDTLHVRIQSGNNLNGFYVAQIDDYKQYVKERDQLMSYSKVKCNIRPEEMKQNKPVSVFVSQLCRYERAMIKTITVPEDKALVQLVDWGSIIEANVQQMKPMIGAYFANPAIAIYCTVEESLLYDNNLQKFLYPGYEFMLTIITSGEQFESPYIVKISPINKRKG